MIARFPGLTSWSDCPVPLTGVLSRDVYADGHEESWLVVTTAAQWSARHIRDRYGLRTDIEERHRQVKCFWDLTRFHSTAWNLIVSQTVFVCLTYSLLQIHLVQQGHEELNRRTWPTTRRLLPDGDRVIVYRQQYFGFFSLLEHMELTLSSARQGAAPRPWPRRGGYNKRRRAPVPTTPPHLELPPAAANCRLPVARRQNLPLASARSSAVPRRPLAPPPRLAVPGAVPARPPMAAARPPGRRPATAYV